MMLKTTGKILCSLVAAALVLALSGVPCAYADVMVPADGTPLLAADGASQTLGNISLANTAAAEQSHGAIAVRGKSFILWTAAIAVLAVGFIVVFNIQRASR